MRAGILTLFCIGSFLSAVCSGDTITVSQDGSGDFTTIQAAIDDANDGDIIIVADGTYTGPGNRDIDFLGKAITVTSENGPQYCIIDCNGTEAERHRGFVFQNGEEPNSVLFGFTITRGWHGSGGGISCSRTSPTITNCIITDNCGRDGGGINIYRPDGPSPVIRNCLIVNNTAEVFGGGVSVRDSWNYSPTQVQLINCTIADNSAEAAGGIFLWYGFSLSITNSIIYRNTATSEGNNIWIGKCDDCGAHRITVSNSDIQEGEDFYNTFRGYVYPFTWGPGNIDVDPCFVDPDFGNYHLSSGSACIDRGDPNFVPLTNERDIDGESRVMNGRVDIGCDEFTSALYPILGVSNRAFHFDANEGGNSPDTQNLSVYNAVPGSVMNWEIAYDCAWLEVTPSSGGSHGETTEVVLDANTSGLERGTYTCQLEVIAEGALQSPQVVEVSVTVHGPIIGLSETTLNFQAVKGQANPPAQTFTVQNRGGRTLDWAMQYNCAWLSVNPSDGSTTDEADEITVSVDTSTICAGTYACELGVTDPSAENSPQVVNVVLHLDDDDGILDVPAEYPNIQAAIDAARAGETVIIVPGDYTGEGNRDLDFLGKGIIVRSADPNDPEVVAATVIDCDGTPSDPHRGFYFHKYEGSDSILAGLTITNGYAERGGGICLDRSNPIIRNCVIRDNFVTYSGGGISSIYSEASIKNCTILHNTAISYGGAISCWSSSTISNCHILSNSADEGGGIHLSGDHATVVNCTIADNSAIDGGGIYVVGHSGEPKIRSCTIANNQASRGGGICCKSLYTTMRNCIIWANSANAGAEIALVGPREIGGQRAYCDVSYSNVRGGREGAYITDTSILYWDDWNIDADPLFAGGEYGDYHLLPNSPCIDSGDPEYVAEPDETDMDGEPRVMGERIDIGADEFSYYEGPILRLEPSEMVFFQADEGNVSLPDQILSISNVGTGMLKWEISGGCSWVNAEPSSGETASEASSVTVSVNPSGLGPGIHVCELLVSGEDTYNSPQWVRIVLRRNLLVPSMYGTIQEAIDDAQDGETVIISPGVYTGDGNRDLDFKGKAITVRSIDPHDPCVVSATVIDCNGSQTDPHRGFVFRSGELQDSIVAGLTIRNGHSIGDKSPLTGGFMEKHGAGIHCYLSSPTISRCVIQNCVADDPTNMYYEHGGGIYCIQSTATITHCVISGNRAGLGGGMYCNNSNVTIEQCMITRNLVKKSDSGGGIDCWDSSPSISHCTIADNEGIGIDCSYASHPVVTHCIIWDRPALAGNPVVTYSDVWGSAPGQGNIWLDPGFVDPDVGDYHLSATHSPCINAGDPNFVAGPGQTDIDGDARLINRRVDIGADEVNFVGPVIEVLPKVFEFVADKYGPPGEPQVLTIHNSGSETLAWEVIEECPWLEANPAGGSCTTEASEVLLNVYVSDLDLGMYTCEFTVQADAAKSPQTVQVVLTVDSPKIVLSKSDLAFAGKESRANPPHQTLTVHNGGVGVLNWALDIPCDWLDVYPQQGSSTGDVNEIVFNADVTGLAPGTYDCQITVYDPGATCMPQIIDVTLNVAGPLIEAVPAEFSFLAETDDEVPLLGVLSVGNSGGGTLQWQIDHDCNWITVEPVSGTCAEEPVEAEISVSPAGLENGLHECTLLISDPNADNDRQKTDVTLVIGPEIGLSESELEFRALMGRPAPDSQTFSIHNSGAGILNWRIEYDCPWLTISPTTGSSIGEPNAVVVFVDAEGLVEDVYICELTVYDPCAYNSPQTVIVELTVSEHCFPNTPEYAEQYAEFLKYKAGGHNPDCWCGKDSGAVLVPSYRDLGYQCDGDVDGLTEAWRYRVFGNDLVTVVKNWKKKIDDPTLDPCADFDHKSETFFEYRVFGKDIAIVVDNWKKRDSALPGDCPRPD